ncbi:uncharacterized protein BKA78DRAFT_55691 [Phyllosticta capitalensis]|uniref:uncharacterized protein n=1 Tax=Phyllosticta capitalensis TaxID=121624 RepID=UPI00312EDF5B
MRGRKRGKQASGECGALVVLHSPRSAREKKKRLFLGLFMFSPPTRALLLDLTSRHLVTKFWPPRLPTSARSRTPCLAGRSACWDQRPRRAPRPWLHTGPLLHCFYRRRRLSEVSSGEMEVAVRTNGREKAIQLLARGKAQKMMHRRICGSMGAKERRMADVGP